MGESIVYALKIALAVAVFIAFSSAVLILLASVVRLATSTILGEIIGLISVYLPFNPANTFALVSSAITVCCGFLISKKIFGTMTNTYEST